MRGGRRAISRGIPRAYRGFPQQHLIALLGDLHPEPAPLEWLYFGGGKVRDQRCDPGGEWVSET